ncbi:MAG: GTP cyclohydrolase [Bacteroides sp. SM23_62]|nr:MAG: GTP cyclohydrolase [Bacteroides sp. SM23_62]
MEIINNGTGPDEIEGYNRIDKFDDERTGILTGLYRQVLDALGEDIRREGLDQTPLRVAKSMQFLTQGYGSDPYNIVSQAMFKEDYNEMVIVKDIDVFSLCEHHLIPFIGRAHVAYIPNGHITGLSKIARVVEVYARRLQVQERLTMQIRDCLENTLKPLGVAVVIEAKHLCMVMRGIQKQNSVTTTSAFTGEFMNNTSTREEFIHLIGKELH